jgi:hypothetical protein
MLSSGIARHARIETGQLRTTLDVAPTMIALRLLEMAPITIKDADLFY